MNDGRPSFSLSEASQLVSVSRSTLRRQLDQGKFPNAFQTTKGVWKLPLTDLLAAGHKPVQGATGDLSTPVHGLSNEQSTASNGISQAEQLELKSRVIELENALSIERAHRSAAEQVANAERNRAQTAELALRMLERAPEQPVTQHEQSAEQVTEHPNPETPDVVEPPRKRRWWQPTR